MWDQEGKKNGLQLTLGMKERGEIWSKTLRYKESSSERQHGASQALASSNTKVPPGPPVPGRVLASLIMLLCLRFGIQKGGESSVYLGFSVSVFFTFPCIYQGFLRGKGT